MENRLQKVIKNIIENGPGAANRLGTLEKREEQFHIYQTYLLSNENDRICLYFAENRNNKTIIFLDIGKPEEKTCSRKNLI